jgi:hypothetical protein
MHRAKVVVWPGSSRPSKRALIWWVLVRACRSSRRYRCEERSRIADHGALQGINNEALEHS